jgi:tetratricopeptide (TPR) repeat protein
MTGSPQIAKMKLAGLILAASALMIGGPGLFGPSDAAKAQDVQAPVEADDIEEQLKSLTAEQLKELLARAATARLKAERETVAVEIKGDLLYEEKDKTAAIRILEDNPASTQDDNIDRICRAFAKADEEFAGVYKPFSAGKYDEALKATKAILDPKKSTYLSAALHYISAESLFRLGRYEDSVEAYGTVTALMPDRISFAAASASKCAQAYEKMNRFYYAAEIYVYCIQNYALTMSADELEKIAGRLEYLQGIYKDPLGSVAERMGQVRSRLEQMDSGDKTRQTQHEIVALLEDLIKTAEEKQSQGGQQSQQQNKSQEQGKSDGQGSGQAKTSGSRPGRRPTNPAQTGYLASRSGGSPKEQAKLGPSQGADDWAKLPPSKRNEIEKAMQRLLPERYRQLIRDYRKQLSKGPAEPQE